MLRPLRIVALVVTLIAMAVAAMLWMAHRGIRHVRPFYREALDSKPIELQQASRELKTQAGALYSDAQHTGDWCAVFTADQLNGWLAVELAQNHPELLPATIRDPRLAVFTDKLCLGFRTIHGGIESVASIDARVFVAESGELAVRLTAVRVGALPLPTPQIVEQIRAASQNWSVPVRWTRIDGDVVALVDVDMGTASDGRRVLLDAIELHEGEIYVTGHTESSDIEKRIVHGKAPEDEQPDDDENNAGATADDVELHSLGPVQVAERKTPANNGSAHSGSSASPGSQSSRQ
jgi:hypothetical protein